MRLFVTASSRIEEAHRPNDAHLKPSALPTRMQMAHLHHLPALFYLVYVRLDMDIDSGRECVRNKLKKTWNKLHPSICETMEVRYKAAVSRRQF